MLRGASVGLESGEQSKIHIWKSSEREIDNGHFCTNVTSVEAFLDSKLQPSLNSLPSSHPPLFYILRSTYHVYLFCLSVCSHLSLLHHVTPLVQGKHCFSRGIQWARAPGCTWKVLRRCL